MLNTATPLPLVGRGPELLVAESSVARLRERQGGALAVVGAAGVGKSRLARAAAQIASDLTVLTGRCVSGGVASPYRPLTEALAPWARAHDATSVELGAHARALDVLTPGWGTRSTDPLSAAFVAEALLRLLPQVSGDRPVLLLVEDLHWADEETLAAIEYLADAAESLPLLLVTTARDDEGPAAMRLLRALAARGSARLVPLGPLDVDATRTMAEQLLGERVSARLAHVLLDRADGLPLFVEELLSALSTGGGLAPSEDGVDVTPTAVAVLPATVSDAVGSRLAVMPDEHRRVIESAALLGRAFDDALLATTYGESLGPALRAATDTGLVTEDPDRPGRLRFRHALLRDGVLASTFPPLRRELARQLLDRMLARDLAGDELALAVELAVRAGNSEVAARLALQRGQDAFDRWALSTADQCVAEARHHCGSDPELLIEIDLLQLRVASLSGRLDVVYRVGQALLARAGSDPVVAVESHLRLAQALLEDDRGDEAEQHLGACASLLQQGSDACTVTRLAMYSSVAALQRDDRDLARRKAVEAAELARPHEDQIDLVCAALMHEGRALLPDVEAARQRWAAALEITGAHGMRLWRGRLLTELATVAADELGGHEELREAEELAAEAGAVELLQRIRLLRARSALLAADLPQAQRLLDLVTSRGQLPTASARAAAELQDALDVLRGAPASLPATRVLQGLLAGEAEPTTAEGPHPLAVVTDITASTPVTPAVAAARAALPDLPAAVARLSAAPLVGALFTLTWADRAEGTREPLVAAIATFEQLGLARPADACRQLLRAGGVPLPRRAAAQDGVPEHLRTAGVTTRELDVLRLIAEGRTNRDIAATLYLSPRTVEKHVERLLLKTGAANRTTLAALLHADANT